MYMHLYTRTGTGGTLSWFRTEKAQSERDQSTSRTVCEVDGDGGNGNDDDDDDEGASMPPMTGRDFFGLCNRGVDEISEIHSIPVE